MKKSHLRHLRLHNPLVNWAFKKEKTNIDAVLNVWCDWKYRILHQFEMAVDRSDRCYQIIRPAWNIGCVFDM